MWCIFSGVGEGLIAALVVCGYCWEMATLWRHARDLAPTLYFLGFWGLVIHALRRVDWLRGTVDWLLVCLVCLVILTFVCGLAEDHVREVDEASMQSAARGDAWKPSWYVPPGPNATWSREWWNEDVGVSAFFYEMRGQRHRHEKRGRMGTKSANPPAIDEGLANELWEAVNSRIPAGTTFALVVLPPDRKICSIASNILKGKDVELFLTLAAMSQAEERKSREQDG